MTRLSPMLRAALTAASSAMLGACAHSPSPPKIAADPIVEEHTTRETTCPSEITGAQPAAVPDYAGGAVTAPEAYFDWLAKHLRREADLAGLIHDAQGQCPQ